MIYVASDLHGCLPADFQKLLDQAGFGDDDFLFILGDVIDRGKWGAEFLLWLTQQPNVQLILGNHELLMLACNFLFDKSPDEPLDNFTAREFSLLQNWLDNGGGTTIEGFWQLLKRDRDAFYGILDYLWNAPVYEEIEVNGKNFILVHSGLGNFSADRALEDYTPEELVLTRPTPETRYYADAHVIFGHTPTVSFGAEYTGRAFHTDTWSCIDVGSGYGYGPMVLRLDDMKEFYLK